MTDEVEEEYKYQRIREVEEIFSVQDGDDPLVMWQFNTTFLMSPFGCTYGRGCRGVEDGKPTAGCCTHGTAIYADDNGNMTDEFPRMEQMMRLLTPDTWESHDHAHNNTSNRNPVAGFMRGEGTTIHTKRHEGACVFQNSDKFHKGPGCALHLAALERGDDVFESKPYVCSYYPLTTRISFDEDTNTTFATVTNELRSTWSEDLDWFCTEDPAQYMVELETQIPLYEAYAREIAHLTSDYAYGLLRDHLDGILQVVRDENGKIETLSSYRFNQAAAFAAPLRPSVVSVPVEITTKEGK